MPDENENKNEKISEKREVAFVSDNIMKPDDFWLQILDLIPFGHPRFTKLLAHTKIFWLLARKKDLEDKLIKCTACLHCGKKLKCRIRETETKLLENIPWQVIQINISSKQRNDAILFVNKYTLFGEYNAVQQFSR